MERKTKKIQPALVPVISGPGKDRSLFVAPARTVLKKILDTKRKDANCIVNSRAIVAIRL